MMHFLCCPRSTAGIAQALLAALTMIKNEPLRGSKSKFPKNKHFSETDDDDYYYKNIKTAKDCSYAIATYLFDSDFDLDELSWLELKRIEKIFGPQMRLKVLENMFLRRHDT